MVGLVNLSAAYEGMRRQCKEWKYRFSRSEADLEEIRMMLHQWSRSTDPVAKQTARSFLLAVVREREVLLQELGKMREAGRRGAA